MEKIAYLVIGGAMAVLAMTLFPIKQSGMDHSAMNMQAMSAMHKHPPREVQADRPVPAVNHLMFPDVMGGFNVQIMTQNFTFTPAAINRAPRDNEGHAHIYVNDVKISRIYGNWYHLPAESLSPGDNNVRVTLNANDHGEWSVEGVPISSTVTIQMPIPTQ